MNREILFRGKRVNNGEWIEGNLVEDDHDSYRMFIVTSAHWDIDEDGYTDLMETEVVEVISETVGQYTGLTDKNGREIFEGDIVRRKERLFTVKYSTEQARFLAFRPNGLHDPIAVKYCEVIGNIHDNPELLKGE